MSKRQQADVEIKGDFRMLFDVDGTVELMTEECYENQNGEWIKTDSISDLTAKR